MAALMAWEVKFKLGFEIKNLNYPGVYMLVHIGIATYSGLDGLWCHDSFQTASMACEVKFDLRLEIGNLSYPGIHVQVASKRHLATSEAVAVS